MIEAMEDMKFYPIPNSQFAVATNNCGEMFVKYGKAKIRLSPQQDGFRIMEFGFSRMEIDGVGIHVNR